METIAMLPGTYPFELLIRSMEWESGPGFPWFVFRGTW